MSRFSAIALLFLCASTVQVLSEEAPPPVSAPPEKQAPAAAPAEPLILEIRQVEEWKRGMNSTREVLFTLEVLVQPGSPIRIRSIQKGQGIDVDGSLDPKEAEGYTLKLKGEAMEEMKKPPPGVQGPAFDCKKFDFDGRAVLDKPALIGEVTDTNKVYRLATFATLKKPDKPADLISEINKHRK